MNELQNWIDIHEERLKTASLIVAALVFLLAVYRWLLQRWRADVSLRKYAYLHPLPSKQLMADQNLQVDVPVSQQIQITLHAFGHSEVIFNDRAAIGVLEIALNMEERPSGEYELTMTTEDQTTLKKVTWSG